MVAVASLPARCRIWLASVPSMASVTMRFVFDMYCGSTGIDWLSMYSAARAWAP